MIYNFDYYKRYEKPTITLCSPDDTEYGLVMNAEGFNINICFSNVSDISYTINYDPSSEADNEIYDKHIKRRQVHVAGVGYFIIDSVVENEDDEKKYKQINAKSCESELNNIAMPFIEGTYQLYKTENFGGNATGGDIVSREDEYLNENCILYEIMRTIPSWTLDCQSDFIDKEKYIELAEKFRTFEISDATIYSFLKNEIQDEYECFVDFDIENRKIRIRTYDDVFEELDAIISKSNILNSCEITSTAESSVNSLKIEGTSGINVGSCNPMGGNIIYNFDTDINSGLIEGVLKDALLYWKSKVDEIENNGILYKPSSGVGKLYNVDTSTFDAWLDFPENLSECKSNLLNNIADGKISNVTDELSEIIASFKNKEFYIAEIDGLIEKITEKGSDTDAIIGSISNVFTEILFEKYQLLPTSNIFTQIKTEKRVQLSELNRQILYATELKNEVESYNTTLSSGYLEGYEAQLEALNTTVIEDGDNSEEKKLLEENKKTVQHLIDLVKAEISSYDKLLTTIGSVIEALNAYVESVCNSCQFVTAFDEYIRNNSITGITGDKLYANLIRYIKQQSYNDETIIATDAMTFDEKFQQETDLYDKSKDILAKASENGFEVKASAESFLFSSEFEELIRRLSIYSALYIELPNGDVPLFHLLKISVNYDENECEFTFGNKMRLSDPAAIFSDLQKTATTAASIVASERIEWGISNEKINELIRQKNMDIDTTFRAMSNSINDTTMGSFGFKCFARDAEGNPSHGIWAANGVMMFMDETQIPKTAIGRIIRSDGTVDYGFYGQSILANTVTADKIVAGALIKGTNYIKNGAFESVNAEKLTSTTTVAGKDCLVGWIGFNNVNTREPEFNVGLYSAGTAGRCVRLYKPNNSSTPGYIYSSEAIMLQAGTYVVSYDLSRALNNYPSSNSFMLDKVGILIGSEKNEGNIANAVASLCKVSNEYSVKFNQSNNAFRGARYYKKFIIDSPVSVIITITNQNLNYAYFDNVMLERAEVPNEYTPHISETYAQYTTIDDRGVNIYNGKLNIFNNNGDAVFKADDYGNLEITGKITAESGGKIGNWLIETRTGRKSDKKSTNSACLLVSTNNSDGFSVGLNPTADVYVGSNFTQSIPAIYAGSVDWKGESPFVSCSFRVMHDGSMYTQKGRIGGWDISDKSLIKTDKKTGMSTDNNHPAFWAGFNGSSLEKYADNTKFYVTQDGDLFAKKIELANDGVLQTSITCKDINGNEYKRHLKISGDSIEFTDNNSSFYSGIFFASSGKNFWESLLRKEDGGSDIAIAGSSKILFGTRPNNSWTALCEIEHSISNKVFDYFYLKPCTGVLDRAMLGSATNPWTDIWVKGKFGIPIQLSAIIQAISTTIAELPVIGARTIYISNLALYGITNLIS